MLWDLIRDFFVMHVFGGYASNGLNYECSIGTLWYAEGEEGEEILSITTLFNLDNTGYQISMGDWLSTTATIISITIIVVLCCLFIYKIIKLIGGLIR